MKIKSSNPKPIIIMSAISLAAILSAPSWGLAEEKSAPSLVISATRYEMPESKVPNNVSVITREEIAHLPVHDVSEALLYTTGVAISNNAGPGSLTSASIQGSEARHVKILIDDVPQEILLDQHTDLSMIPIEHVERIEVLKGSASSVWGSSLGGVINIVTRKPTEEFSGDAGVIVGEGKTRRYSGAVSGTSAGIGYFLSASRFETNGLVKNQDTDTLVNNFYGKLTRDLTKELKLELSYNNSDNRRHFDYSAIFPLLWDNKNSDSFGRAKIEYTPSTDLTLSLSAFKRQFTYKQEQTDPSSLASLFIQDDREDSYGGTFKSVWRHSDKGTASMGIDASNWVLNDSTQTQRYYTDKKAIYFNESYQVGNLNLTAGIRYDDDSAFGSETSPSAGLVYNIEGTTTLFRLNAARGFTPPNLGDLHAGTNPNKDLHAERAWTYQGGLETRDIPGIWGKVTLYRADVTNAIEGIFDANPPFAFIRFENIKNFRRQGIEVEARTNEFMGVSLFYGYAFNDVRDTDLDVVVKNKARETHDIGLDYRGPFETRTTVKGHYIDWNPDPTFNAKDRTFVWDARVSKYLAYWKKAVGEIFVSMHNITDENQYSDEIFKNPGRWVEGGVSLSF